VTVESCRLFDFDAETYVRRPGYDSSLVLIRMYS
jgi:hypothetical protein